MLKEEGPTGVLFEPPLTEKQAAIKGLETGAVVKVVLHFRSDFWPVKNFGFLHADDPNFPTWWVDERGPLLTGWAGGPRAERLSPESHDTILAEAIESLIRIFKVERRRIGDLLVSSWTHDWTNDHFSRGAYSYVPVGMGQMPGTLSEPVQDTLFFAGEATADPGDQGTVHGALASAKRAVQQIRKSGRLRGRSPRRLAAARA